MLGAAYATSKKYWQRLRGLEGLHNYGSDEQFISLKVWLEGGRCTLLKDVVVGHIYRKHAPYQILGRDSAYNLLLIAKLLFPVAIYCKVLAAATIQDRELTYEATQEFEKNKFWLQELQEYLNSIFTRKVDDILPMHLACREFDRESLEQAAKLMSDIEGYLWRNIPSDSGLMFGKTGVLLWLAHYEAFKSDIQIDDLTDKLYNEIGNDITGKRLPWNFRYGVAGIGWGLLYMYSKGLLPFYPQKLIEEIDTQLAALDPENINDMNLETGCTGILAYLTLRLTSGHPAHPSLPLERWYRKAHGILDYTNKPEIIYYASLYSMVSKEEGIRSSPASMIGVWLNAPSYFPQSITSQNCTLTDGILGTTLMFMLLTSHDL